MPKEHNLDDLPPEDLEALSTAQADWDGDGENTLPEEDEAEIVEDLLGVEVEDADDVIDEDDDNPYQESDEALPDDDEERDISRQLIRE